MIRLLCVCFILVSCSQYYRGSDGREFALHERCLHKHSEDMKFLIDGVYEVDFGNFSVCDSCVADTVYIAR